MLLRLCMFFWLALSGTAAGVEATLDGVVVNATRDQPAAPGTEVVLRGWLDGQLATLARTTTGIDGAFRFTGLPCDVAGLYLPGANQGGVHFPGKRVRLSAEQNQVSVQLTVYDAIANPNPLVIETHQVDVFREDNTLRIREVLTVCNPTQTCYVGSTNLTGGLPVTLQLSIPSTFSRITFDKEAFGRRFRLINENLVTDLPWPPGSRELAFSYILPWDTEEAEWHRPINLPTAEITVRVHTLRSSQVRCNLLLHKATGEYSEYSATEWSPESGPIQVSFQNARPSVNYARRIAVLLLLGLVAVVSVRANRKPSRADR